MIAIIHNPDKTYYHILGINGAYGIIELVDEHYRAEHYGDPIGNHSVMDNDYWEVNPLFYVGEYETITEAIMELLIEMELIHPYLVGLIKNCSAPTTEDWLVDPICCDDQDVDVTVRNWLDDAKKQKWMGRAKDCTREGEFFETYEVDPDQASKCYRRAEYFEFLAELVGTNVVDEAL